MNAFIDIAPTLGLLFFFTLFLCIALRTYHPRAKAALQALALIPLKEDAE